jgi:hypothetical protein
MPRILAIAKITTVANTIAGVSTVAVLVRLTKLVGSAGLTSGYLPMIKSLYLIAIKKIEVEVTLPFCLSVTRDGTSMVQ